MSTFLTALLAIILLFPPASTDAGLIKQVETGSDPVTFVVVRHAEKAANSSDPDLSEAGLARAERLAAILQYMRVDGLHSTPFKRTRQTLGVLAERHELTVQEYDPRNPNSYLDALMGDFGKTHVIAGHSNTAPKIVNYLAGNSVYEDLEDHVYDHLWIVHRYPDGSTKTLLLHY